MLENGPEVNFDKLPLRTMTEMAKYPAQNKSRSKVKKHLAVYKSWLWVIFKHWLEVCFLSSTSQAYETI